MIAFPTAVFLHKQNWLSCLFPCFKRCTEQSSNFFSEWIFFSGPKDERVLLNYRKDRNLKVHRPIVCQIVMELDQSEIRKPKPGDAKGERKKERESKLQGEQDSRKVDSAERKNFFLFPLFSFWGHKQVVCVCVCVCLVKGIIDLWTNVELSLLMLVRWSLIMKRFISVRH